mgnify:CR=1 FL=1
MSHRLGQRGEVRSGRHGCLPGIDGPDEFGDGLVADDGCALDGGARYVQEFGGVTLGNCFN